MWIRKNKQETAEMQEKTIPKKRKKRKFSQSMNLALMLLVFSFLYHKFGFSPFEAKPKPWNEVFLLLPRIFAYSFLLFCVSYLFLFRKETIDKLYICLSCQNKTNKPEKNMQCKCGGEYIDMDLLKWVEDEPADDSKTTEDQNNQ